MKKSDILDKSVGNRFFIDGYTLEQEEQFNFTITTFKFKSALTDLLSLYNKSDLGELKDFQLNVQITLEPSFTAKHRNQWHHMTLNSPEMLKIAKNILKQLDWETLPEYTKKLKLDLEDAINKSEGLE